VLYEERASGIKRMKLAYELRDCMGSEVTEWLSLFERSSSRFPWPSKSPLASVECFG
jgi:hypothetical protein